MFEAEIPCSDGTSENCWGTITNKVEIPDLTPEQCHEIKNQGYTYITAEQVREADQAVLELDDIDRAALDRGETIRYDFPDIEPTCSPCGRDGD